MIPTQTDPDQLPDGPPCARPQEMGGPPAADHARSDDGDGAHAVRSRSGVTWWRSAVNRSFFRVLATCRTRSSPWGTLSRSCARRVRSRPAFPSAPALRSTGSADGCPSLFAGFAAVESEEVGLLPFLRPLAQTARAVFPQAAFLCGRRR